MVQNLGLDRRKDKTSPNGSNIFPQLPILANPNLPHQEFFAKPPSHETREEFYEKLFNYTFASVENENLIKQREEKLRKSQVESVNSTKNNNLRLIPQISRAEFLGDLTDSDKIYKILIDQEQAKINKIRIKIKNLASENRNSLARSCKKSKKFNKKKKAKNRDPQRQKSSKLKNKNFPNKVQSWENLAEIVRLKRVLEAKYEKLKVLKFKRQRVVKNLNFYL